MNQKELESYLWGAAKVLRGTIDAGDYKQYIFPLLFFKRICDVYDEEFETPATPPTTYKLLSLVVLLGSI